MNIKKFTSPKKPKIIIMSKQQLILNKLIYQATSNLFSKIITSNVVDTDLIVAKNSDIKTAKNEIKNKFI